MVRIKKCTEDIRHYELECDLGFGRSGYFLQIISQKDGCEAAFWLLKNGFSVLAFSERASSGSVKPESVLAGREPELRSAARKLNELSRYSFANTVVSGGSVFSEGAIYACLLKLDRGHLLGFGSYNQIIFAARSDDLQTYIQNMFDGSGVELGLAFVVNPALEPASVVCYQYRNPERMRGALSKGIEILLCERSPGAQWLMNEPKSGYSLLLIRNGGYYELVSPERI